MSIRSNEEPILVFIFPQQTEVRFRSNKYFTNITLIVINIFLTCSNILNNSSEEIIIVNVKTKVSDSLKKSFNFKSLLDN